VDELWSGVTVTGAPAVERELGLSHAGYVVFVFVGPLLLAALLEGGLALLSDRVDRRRLLLGGQAALASALAFVAWAPSAWGLSAGLAVAGAASGVACGAAQAVLVAGDPQAVDRAMVRWTLFASIGDVLTPLLTAASLALGCSYRAALLAIALLVLLQLLASIRARASGLAGGSARDDGDPPPEPLVAAVARAARLPRLWTWLFAAASCTLLDELVIALAALHLRREQGWPESLAAAAAIAFATGSVAGASFADRAVARFGRRRVLFASAAGCTLALFALLLPLSPLAACGALFLLGCAAAPHHPLALAQAYEELPRNPGTVQAFGQVFVGLEVLAPLVVGEVADHFGLRAAVGCLLAQPLLIAAASFFARERPDVVN
jgi:MFS family permease